MNRLQLKNDRLKRRITRVRHSIRPKSSRARLVYVRSNRYLSVQLIDDLKGLTICSATTREKDFSGNKKDKEAAAKLGKIIADRAKAKGITRVVLDRRGRLYHGRMAAFAESAREAGLEF